MSAQAVACEHCARMREALIAAAAHLTGAASAYRKHAARHKSKGRAVPDAMFATRADDFDKAAAAARAAIATALRPTGAQPSTRFRKE